MRERLIPLLLTAALAVSCGRDTPHLPNGSAAPGFALPQLNSEPLRFPEDLRGQVVAVRFWADWCPFCETEMRDIEPLYRAHRDEGLRVLAVNVRQDRDTALAFTERLGVTYDVLLDGDGSVARAYGVIGLPTTIFVDRDGKIATRILGESTPEVFAGVLRGLL